MAIELVEEREKQRHIVDSLRHRISIRSSQINHLREQLRIMRLELAEARMRLKVVDGTSENR